MKEKQGQVEGLGDNLLTSHGCSTGNTLRQSKVAIGIPFQVDVWTEPTICGEHMGSPVPRLFAGG